MPRPRKAGEREKEKKKQGAKFLKNNYKVACIIKE
jgi:hypothetical protein